MNRSPLADPDRAADAPHEPRVSVVVPVRDERENLLPLDLEIRSALDALGRPAEIVYVDDGSSDGSLARLREIVAESRSSPHPTTLVRLRRSFGQTAALAAGFDRCRGEIVVSLDGDGQNDPADIPDLVAALEEGYDLVSGWRRRRNDPALTRRLPSLAANWLVGRITGLPLHDFGCTFKAYRRSTLDEIDLYGEMHRFIPAYALGFGRRVAEVEVHHRPRARGVSKYGLGRIFKVLVDLVLIRYMTHYFARPMHFFGQIAYLFLTLAGATLALMVAFKYGWLSLIGVDYRASFIETPLPALAATFFLGGVLSIFCGLLGEVLTRIHHESQGLKPYRIDFVEPSDRADHERP